MRSVIPRRDPPPRLLLHADGKRSTSVGVDWECTRAGAAAKRREDGLRRLERGAGRRRRSEALAGGHQADGRGGAAAGASGGSGGALAAAAAAGSGGLGRSRARAPRAAERLWRATLGEPAGCRHAAPRGFERLVVDGGPGGGDDAAAVGPAAAATAALAAARRAAPAASARRLTRSLGRPPMLAGHTNTDVHRQTHTHTHIDLNTGLVSGLATRFVTPMVVNT